MNILIYTIATNDKNSFECTNLLYKSLKKFFPLNFDFRIVVAKQDKYVCSSELKDSLLEINPYNHIFKFKYSSSIPYDDYSHFIYLDSDILWMLNDITTDLDFINHQYIYTEGRIYGNSWSKYWPFGYKQILKDDNMKNHQFGINAGFFILNQFYMKQLYQFMNHNLHSKHIYSRNRFLEQNMFNLFIYKNFYMNKNNKDSIRIFTENMVCKTTAFTPYYRNKVYHFDGNMCNMEKKLKRMTSFLIKNSIVL